MLYGYLSGTRCRFAYGPADLTATHFLLLQKIQTGFGFTFLVLAHPGNPGQNPASHKFSCSCACENVISHCGDLDQSSGNGVRVHNTGPGFAMHPRLKSKMAIKQKYW